MRGSLNAAPFRLPYLTTMGRMGLVCALLLCAAALLSAQPVACPPPQRPAPAVATPEADLVGVPVPLAEPAAVLALRPGARVDVVGVGHPAAAVTGAIVLTADPDAALLLGMRPAEAARVTSAPIGTVFRVIVRL